MKKYISLLAFGCCLNLSSQDLQETFQPIDLIGTWEYNIPTTNEYIAFTFVQEFDIVLGEFKMFTKDANGNVESVIFDSSVNNSPNKTGVEAFFGPRPYNYDSKVNTFACFIIDDGVTNLGTSNNRKIYLTQLVTFEIIRNCTGCNLQLAFTLIPKKEGINTYDQDYIIKIPENMLMDKI